MNKIITLGDIFKNIETEDKAYNFLKYIKNLQEKDKEIERLNNIINEYEKWLNDLGAWCYVEKLKELKDSGNNE